MASALTILFLGCWLAGQSGVPGEETDRNGDKHPDPPMPPPQGEGGSESDLNSAIIAGVIVGAAGLLLLLLLLLCRRCTRARKGPASRQSRELEAATATTVYALVGQGKQQDVPPQEPDPGAEGLTYTELDRQALQAKQEAPAPAPEPVLYATVSRSQGAPPPPPSPEPGRVTETTGQGARPPGSDTATPPGEQAQLTVSA
ncbi:uncharacterized protein LOC142825591 [Pelodiscus sinensis]|uniref:uncharacterized protein LOC142825591 n=1 Tax=Pelodiscus sinensis TaxID=13735 RepID=UPI003F6AC584